MTVRTQRHPDSDLMRSLGHDKREQAIEPNRRQYQRQSSHHNRKRAYHLLFENRPMDMLLHGPESGNRKIAVALPNQRAHSAHQLRRVASRADVKARRMGAPVGAALTVALVVRQIEERNTRRAGNASGANGGNHADNLDIQLGSISQTETEYPTQRLPNIPAIVVLNESFVDDCHFL